MSSTKGARKPKALPAPNAEDPPGEEYEDNPFYADDSWKYAGQFNYRKPVDGIRGPGKAHGRKGVSDLFALVSSRNHRDIVRRNEFMSKPAFEQWNTKQVALGRETCWADMEDYDNDGEKTEFVVRRRDAKGPVIAVNGYTTKPSDWHNKRLYYAAYPTRASRSSDLEKNPDYKSYRDFINEQYGYEEDAEGFATEAYLKKRTAAMADSPYNLRLKNPSAYSIFQSRIVFPAYKKVMDVYSGGNEETAKKHRKQCEDKYGKGWVMKEASEKWDSWVRQPIIDALDESGELREYVATFQGKKRASKKTPNFVYNPEDEMHVAEFVRWLFSRPEIKEAQVEYVRPLFNRENEAFKRALNSMQNHLDDMVADATEMASPQNSPYKSKIPRHVARI